LIFNAIIQNGTVNVKQGERQLEKKYMVLGSNRKQPLATISNSKTEKPDSSSGFMTLLIG